ncbi:MAG: hypothetical protein FWC20_04240 [Oscillospiraceae bacterium]|nr:hypothetical protein [Oscillospiraceae bacterium]MCL2278601.1 hypothetical protein [Oscillospiraceae bacterium]
MSKGYSDQFVGTAGSVERGRYYQISFDDELPVRIKATEVNAGNAGKASAMKNKEIKAALILLMCKHCRTKKITAAQLVDWLIMICLSTNVIIEAALQTIIDNHLVYLREFLLNDFFWEYLSKLEMNLAEYNKA